MENSMMRREPGKVWWLAAEPAASPSRRTNRNRGSSWSALALLCLLLLTGLRIAGADSKPAPAHTVPNYRLGPGDVLDIAVPTHEGMNASLAVQPDGRIYYPYL